ncbi:MAG: peptidase S41 [Anaerolineaceae bacterium]|nr:peptidase S41 [Anaerolineaceae bacterium]
MPKSLISKSLTLWILLLLALTGAGFTPQPAAAAPSPQTAGPAEGPQVITGEFTYSNDFVLETYYVEHAVALNDMTGFVKRDKEWELPIAGQVLGFLQSDPENNKASYRLLLPVKPEGEFNDVDNNDKDDPGVQIFAVTYSPNLTGGPYSEGDDPSFGWPTYLASVKTDTENHDEVISGKLIVWAPDDKQAFPTGFGKDGLLFTSDDPAAAIPAGYSIVDLDKNPFALSQSPENDLPLYEPDDVAIKDFSSLSYSAAFDKMFEILKKEYAFNGIKSKQPNWNQLYDRVSQKVKAAEKVKDPQAYFLALQEFTFAFQDGHVGLDGGDIGNQIFDTATNGGYGLAIRELDNGKVIVTYVLSEGPASQAGIQVGAEVLKFNGEAIKTAIDKVVALSGPFSTDFTRRYQQARYLLRAAPDTKAELTFINPGGVSQTAALTAIPERASFSASSLLRNYDPNALPVDFKILESGAGYVRVNSNYDDLNLAIRLFERALSTFESNGVTGVIIDMRLNFGGAPLGLAGFLYDQKIPLGQLEYYSEKTGKFEPEGPRDEVLPSIHQYKFKKLVLLVDQNCYSACEIEAYGFSRIPGIVVVGQYPTAGVEAEVARGQFLLPEGFSLQAPTGRFTLPNGSIFLEGIGVKPTRRVPIDMKNALSTEDIVLQTAEDIISRP